MPSTPHRPRLGARSAILARLLAPAAVALLLPAAVMAAGGRPMPLSVTAATLGAPAPRVILEDVPFTRNQRLELIVMKADGTGPVVERRASNDPATVDGILVNGSTVVEVGQWTLASGADGPRTVYAQVRYEDGAWSAVGSASIALDVQPSSSLYVDVDPSPVFHDITTSVPDPDWTRRSVTPGDQIWGRGIPAGSGPPVGFGVHDAEWAVWFEHRTGPITPGAYEAQQQVGECASTCVTVVLNPVNRCSGTGTFTIHDIAFTPDGDLDRVAADFRLACQVYGLMSGSIRYGSERGVTALDQSHTHVSEGLNVGDDGDPHTVTFSNVGTLPAQLGPAVIEGEVPGDWAIVADDCSGALVSAGGACSVSVRFSPTSYGKRFARLVIADGTARGARSVRLLGNATQPTSLGLSVEPTSPGPSPVTFVVTIYPGTAGTPPLLVDGEFVPGKRIVSSQVLSNPSRRVVRWEVWLSPGPHTARAMFDGGNYHLAAEPVTTQVTVPTAQDRPWGDAVFASNATVTATRAVTVWAIPRYSELTLNEVALSHDGVTWSTRMYGPWDQPWTLTAGDGMKTVYVRWREWPSGYWSPPVSASIRLDTTLPTATAPAHKIMMGAPLVSGRVPVRLTWSGADGGSGIARYEVARQTDGGVWTPPSKTSSASFAPGLAPGHLYRFRVRSVDRAGNLSAWQYGATFTVSAYSEAHAATRYTGTWGRATSSSFWGGAVRYAISASARATFTFSGRSVGFVSTMSTSRGRAAIYVNGAHVTTIDLHSATWRNGVVAWSQSWSTSARRTVEVRVLGTAGRPRVDLDGWVVGS